MKFLIILIIGFFTSFLNAQTPEAQCAPNSPDCKTKHSEEDEHDHDHPEEKDGHSHSAEEKPDEHAHDDHAGKEEDKHEGHDDHKEEHAHAKGDDHDKEEGHGHEEGSSQVGSEKGVLEASEANGFKLSPEAIKNFELKYVLVEKASIKLPTEAILHAKEEKNIYRLRDGFIKRVDFKVISKSRAEYIIESKELKSGDQILIKGLGFVRMAEIAAFGGAPEGHSH